MRRDDDKEDKTVIKMSGLFEIPSVVKNLLFVAYYKHNNQTQLLLIIKNRLMSVKNMTFTIYFLIFISI
jgi:hypothetical protein